MSINLLRHAKVSVLCQLPVQSAVSCTPKQIDLQAFFITTAALLCQRVIVVQYKRPLFDLAPPQSILTKQI